MNIVDKIVSTGLCTGCGLCESIAPSGEIKISLSPPGLLRPIVLSKINQETEKNIKKCCPGFQISHQKQTKNYHVNWGPLESVNVGHATDSFVRKGGSSGGVLSALAIFLLESKKVDFIAQIAVSRNNPINNELQISRTREDVMRAAGSRYGPSSPLQTIRQLIETGEKFAFIGKPCDVAALRAYLRNHQHIADQIPYILSFMCAGIPSVAGTHEVLETMGADIEKISSFRYRGDGWPGMARAIQEDGKVFEMDYNKSWGSILGKHLQFRCKICADGTGEFADIVCADAWHGKNGYPDFAERDGRSLILSRTEPGQQLLEMAINAGTVDTESLPVSDIALMQPYQLNRKQLAAARGIATFLSVGISTRYWNLSLIKAMMQARPLTILRNAWGTYRRANGESLSAKSK